MLKAVFFDLDGTLLRFDENKFLKMYFQLLCEKTAKIGYEPKKLIDTIWKGTALMYHNNGEKTNEVVFWEAFQEEYGKESLNDKPYFDSFYRNEFRALKEITEASPLSHEIVKETRALGLKPILSTNPIFPMVGQLTRISFLDLKEDDFDYITSYENSSYSKPNPMYFKMLLDKFSLKPEEVIVFGNNDYEDGDCASALGIKVYLVDGYLIRSEKAKGNYPIILLSNVVDVIKEEMKNHAVIIQ